MFTLFYEHTHVRTNATNRYSSAANYCHVFHGYVCMYAYIHTYIHVHAHIHIYKLPCTEHVTTSKFFWCTQTHSRTCAFCKTRKSADANINMLHVTCTCDMWQLLVQTPLSGFFYAAKVYTKWHVFDLCMYECVCQHLQVRSVMYYIYIYTYIYILVCMCMHIYVHIRMYMYPH